MKKINLEIYNPEKTYLYPNMQIATPEHIQANYSAVNNFKCVITTDSEGEMFYSVEPLNAMAQRLGVDKTQYVTDEELLEAMEEILNTPPAVNTEPTAEERIASALEYQNLIAE